MSEQKLSDAEVLLYGCLVKFSNDDEDNPYDVYDRAYKFLGLPDRMQELKAKWIAFNGDAIK